MTIQVNDADTTAVEVEYRFYYPFGDAIYAIRVTPCSIGSTLTYDDVDMVASLDAWALGVASAASTANGHTVTAKRHYVLEDNNDEVTL
jgi:hypothetical protein